MIEIWKDIKNLEGKYQVSNLGNIMSLNYRGTGKAKLMKPRDNGNGYLQVGFWQNRKKDNFYIHRLVAQAFLPNPENKPEVNHKIDTEEGKKINIVYLNEDGSVDEEKSTIEWCTHEYNNNYGTRTLRVAKAKSKPVLQFTLDGKFVKEWESVRECGRNGFTASSVAACCNGKLKSHKGYIWRYKEDYS